MRKLRWILLLLALCAALTLPALAAADAVPPIPTEGDVWDGTAEAPTEIIQRDGVNYYRITKCSQLAYLATDTEYQSYNYILENDLILNDVEFTWDEEGNLLNDTAELRQWTPISNFKGKLLGNGWTISGLYIVSEEKYTTYTGMIRSLRGEVTDLHIVNSHVQGREKVSEEYDVNDCAGAIAGTSSDSKINGCSFSGVVRGYMTGGLLGEGSSRFSDCVNYGTIYGKSNVGGIAGSNYYNVASCRNYGTVVASAYAAGGIVGDGGAENCQNYGAVIGKTRAGGIAGSPRGDVEKSSNFGTVTGESEVGGIAGLTSRRDYDIRDCYTFGTVTGTEDVGGIVGNAFDYAADLVSSYNIGSVTGTTNVGTVVGKSGSVWGTGSVSDCYYLKTGDALQPFGNYTGDIEGSVTGLSEAELKDRETFPAYEYVSGKGYVGWDFDEIWAINPEKNGGYPYLQGQELKEIPVTGVSLNKTALTLGAGDQEYLVAAVSPATAKNTACTWRSSAPAVASVSAQGRVEALAAGQAVITVTTVEGDFTASCTVTVTERSQTEYRINGITLTDAAGADLEAIPQGSFWVTVSLTHMAAEGDAMVMLASYDASGRYLGMLCARAEDLPVGSSIRLSVWMDNSNGEIAHVRAFLVPSLANLTPIGESVGI